MRLAVLSDVHGNRWALDAVVADARRLGADAFVNLGDLLSGPLDPAGTADRLLALGWPTLAGNHERQLLACAEARGGPSDQHAFERTAERHRAWLRGLPATLALGDGVLACHGTPGSDVTALLEEIGPWGIRPAAAAVVEERLAGVAAELVLCGHSHLPRVRALAGGRLAVNPGSVGLPAYEEAGPFPFAIESGSPHARYALCERGAAGWDVSLRCVAYDHRSAAAAARQNGRGDWGRWLETGRA